MSVPVGFKVFCPYCKAHYVTTTAPVRDGDPRSGRYFVYADGSPVHDADEVKCRPCGKSLTEEVNRQIVSGRPL